MRKATTCAACLSAFSVETNMSTAAALTNAKTRGGLTHPTFGIFNLLKHAERLFVDYADWNTVYWDTIDGVLDTYTLTFPCPEHKEEVIARLRHYYVSMRMRGSIVSRSTGLWRNRLRRRWSSQSCADHRHPANDNCEEVQCKSALCKEVFMVRLREQSQNLRI